MATTLTDPLLGRVLDGRYRLGRRLARGGMATVYAAEDVRLERRVAVKIMHAALAADPDFVQRFIREARSAARLSHPDVVQVFDQGTDDGLVFLVMEYVDGRTLRDLICQRRRLGPAEAVTVLEPVLAALGAAHREGLVHRDVKPENVLVGYDGRVKVVDFGLAKAADSGHTATSGVLLGTVAYLAPEQVLSGGADPRTDVYAAGILLFEMLTGAPPYAGDSPLSIAYRHVHEDVPAPSAVPGAPPVPPQIDRLVRAATARDPSARPADAIALLRLARTARADLALPVADLSARPAPQESGPGRHVTAVLAGAPPRHTAVDPRSVRVSATPRRRRTLPVLLFVLLLAGLAAGAWWFGPGRWTSAPGLYGLDRATAVTAADRRGFDVTFAPEQFSEARPPGAVADQQPAPGGRIRRGGTVTVALSKGPERYAVPELAGMTRAAALEALRTNHLTAGEVSLVSDDSVPEGQVVSSDPPPGLQVKPGTAVGLRISSGPPPVSVPDVSGRPADNATDILRDAGLQATRRTAFDDTVPAGQVVSQRPTAGTTARKGDTVTLTVSKGPQLVTVPDVRDRNKDDALAALRAAGLQPEVGIEIPGGPDNVLRISPGEGEQVRRGSTVTVDVF